VAFLVATYKLLVQSMHIYEVLKWLERLHDSEGQFQFQISDDLRFLLRALAHAQKKHFVRYLSAENNGLLCDSIDEHLHYISPLNGGVHIVIPGKLVIIPNPADLPDGQLWEDAHSDAGATRAFSASFHADLLLHLDVHLVANFSCSDTDGPNARATAATDAFEAAGLACEDVLLPPGSPAGSLLRAHDRLMTLVRATSGAIALQCGGGGSALGTSAVAGTVVAAVLMEQEGFGAAEAEAWLRLMCPRLLPPS
jgi:hypothetical protein